MEKNKKNVLFNICNVIFNVKKQQIFVVFLCGLSVFLLGMSKYQAIQQISLAGARNYHIKPKNIDDQFSEDVYQLYLTKVDPSKRFLTKKKLKEVEQYKTKIDNQTLAGQFEFFIIVDRLMKEQVSYVKSIYPDILSKGFSFNNMQTLKKVEDETDYVKDNMALYEYWFKLIKYQVLTEIINIKQANVSSNQLITEKLTKSEETQATEKVKKNLDDLFKRIDSVSEEERRNIYVDTLINVFDTHTSYFPPEKKEDFDINISGRLEGIGAVLSQENEFIKVLRLVPGSAAWRQGSLKAEDIILKVSQGDEPPHNLVGVKVRDAVNLIRGKRGTEVRLTVKHANDDVEVIPIIRDIVLIEETYAKSTIILDKRSNRKFGYIYLPKFYRDFSNPQSSRNTTDDVKKAIVDLKKSNVNGVILDLRDNSGGALVDAVNTAGLFINEGPIVQVKGKMLERIYTDVDKDILFSGPLVIMINTYSASASEILAAALQDYGRAIIVGSNTFGKGTVQTFIDLDKLSPSKALFYDPLGSIKITIQKFYRINGKTTQYHGVYPDITLPDAYASLEVGERYLDFSLKGDEVKQLPYDHYGISNTQITMLRDKSQQRINKSEEFQKILKYMTYLDEKKKMKYYSLNLKNAVEDKIKNNEMNKLIKQTKVEKKHYSFSNPSNNDLSKVDHDNFKNFIDKIKDDIQIHESLSILNDLVENKLLSKVN